jgi:putative hydrolase of the HAD superfamily
MIHTPMWPRPTLKAIFLDAAGTLFRLREPVGRTYSRIAARHGIQADPDRLEAAFRTAWRSLPPPLHPENRPPSDDDRSWWRELVGQTFLHGADRIRPDDPLDSLFDDLYAHYGEADAWRLHEDTLEAVTGLSRRFRLLVLSNFDRRLPGILAGLGLTGFFERLIISSEVGAAKPHPRMFRAALAACGLPPEECLHVGDDFNADIAGARAAGLASFHLHRPETTLATLLGNLSGNDFPACIRPNPD